MERTNIPKARLEHINNAFRTLKPDARPEKPSGQCTYRKYSFAEAAKSPSYKISPLTPAEIVSYYTKVTSEEYKEMSEKDFFDFIQIALSLPQPMSGEAIFSAPPYPAEQLCSDYATAGPRDIGKVKFDKAPTGAVSLPLVPPAGSGPQDMVIDEEERSKAQAICFLFAWLTRFTTKMPSDALAVQFDQLRTTYIKFYQSSSCVFDKFRPQSVWLKGLRDASDTFSRVKNTLILHVASSETKYKSDPKVFNILRFLYYQNLEFMGLHGYVSIVNIMSKVALPPAQILTWLNVSGAEFAITEAYEMMKELDNGMIPNGTAAERLWKYARCIDQGYFNRLQTSYSADLMAMLAYIEIGLGISNETGYNSPLRIYAIANNPNVREVGKAKAEAFIMCKNSVMALSEDSSVIDVVYANERGIHARTEATPKPAQEEATTSRKRPHEESSGEKTKKAPPQLTILSGIPEFP
uniref:Nucleoprotein n=1 Tax=Canadian violet rhabdovirus 2 TaxID=2933135 RepID=A0A9C7GWK3_9RHAB|nr:N putative nucleocapsid protein [Canadian violet rhabdovirus 2]CAI5383920.1 N putative nucleocapsid protein [Canadian violet rhabdovirus 2]